MTETSGTNSSSGEETVVDLGCGGSKTPGSLGVDLCAGPGVDVVADLNSSPWPLDDNRFDRIVGRHVIEHVEDVVVFMSEVHRIGRNGATVEITTPHFSSTNTWKDPTHLRHLSLGWYEVFLSGGYLSGRTGLFELVSESVEFGSGLRPRISRLAFVLTGARRWEKHSAFIWRARDFTTVLRIVKP